MSGEWYSCCEISCYLFFLCQWMSLVRQRHQQILKSHLGKGDKSFRHNIANWESLLCTHASLKVFFYKWPHVFKKSFFHGFTILIWNFCKEVESYFHHLNIMSLKFNILSLCDIWFTYLCFGFILKLWNLFHI